MSDKPTAPPHVSHFAGRHEVEAFCVHLGPAEVYFSHGTCIAFRAPGCGLVVLELPDSKRTLRGHAARLDGRRVDADEFLALYRRFVADALAGAQSGSTGTVSG